MDRVRKSSSKLLKKLGLGSSKSPSASNNVEESKESSVSKSTTKSQTISSSGLPKLRIIREKSSPATRDSSQATPDSARKSTAGDESDEGTTTTSGLFLNVGTPKAPSAAIGRESTGKTPMKLRLSSPNKNMSNHSSASSTKNRNKMLALRMSEDEEKDEDSQIILRSPSNSVSRSVSRSVSKQRAIRMANEPSLSETVAKLGVRTRVLEEFLTVGTLLGKGNSGSVSKGLDRAVGKMYALKTVQTQGTKGDENRSQTVKEVLALTSLSSPYIVGFHGLIVDDERVVFVLEYMNRGSLQDVLDSGCHVDEFYIKRIAKMLLLGLNDVHKHNIVHRDIKPGNILSNRKGEVKIADFGIVRELGESKNAANTFVGTQSYMSPERIEHDPYSFASDIWSLGLTILTLANGEFPYKDTSKKGFLVLFQAVTGGPVPLLHSSKCSAQFNEFIGHFLEKNPNNRWTCSQLLEHEYLNGVNLEENVRWPWDATFQAKDENTLADIAQVLGDHVFTKGYSRSSVDTKLFTNIGDSLGMSGAEVQIYVERNLPIHCFAADVRKTSTTTTGHSASSSYTSMVVTDELSAAMLSPAVPKMPSLIPSGDSSMLSSDMTSTQSSSGIVEMPITPVMAIDPVDDDAPVRGSTNIGSSSKSKPSVYPTANAVSPSLLSPMKKRKFSM